MDIINKFLEKIKIYPDRDGYKVEKIRVVNNKFDYYETNILKEEGDLYKLMEWSVKNHLPEDLFRQLWKQIEAFGDEKTLTAELQAAEDAAGASL